MSGKEETAPEDQLPVGAEAVDDSAEEHADPNLPKEHPIFSETSLLNLGKILGDKGMMFAMYLNIPTTRLVYIKQSSLKERIGTDYMSREFLFYWKQMRETAKDKEKFKDLAKVLTLFEFEELAKHFWDMVLNEEGFAEPEPPVNKIETPEGEAIVTDIKTEDVENT